MTKAGEVGHAILVRAIGFIIFLVLIGILNLLSYYISNPLFNSIVGFINSNLLLIVIFTIVFIIADIFYYLWFPLDLPAPLLSGFASVLLLRFIFNIIGFILRTIGLSIVLPISSQSIYIIAAIIVFIVVVIVGYAEIFRRAMRKRRMHSNNQGYSDDDERPVKVKRVHRRHSEE